MAWVARVTTLLATNETLSKGGKHGVLTSMVHEIRGERTVLLMRVLTRWVMGERGERS